MACQHAKKLDTDATLSRLRQFPMLRPEHLGELQARFETNDRDGSGDLSPEEFQRALRECGVRLSTGEVKQLFTLFDTDASGTIVYDEFVRGLRGGSAFSKCREDVVDAAFRRFDVDQTGETELAPMQDAYDATQHPDCRAGRKSAVQVLREFVRKVDVSGNGMVRRELFRDYYMELSTSIEDDEQFEEIVHLSWYPQRRQAWGKAEATEVEGGYGGGEEGRRRSRGNTKETSSSSRGKSPWRTRPF